jgi:tRNA-2-methylthio-N6-dimethylallyladenosine synthase
MKSATPERRSVEASEAATGRLTQLYVETYGCQMNEYDSGLVRSILGADGYRIVQSPEEAGVILLNTCAIREKAHEKVYNRLEALGYLKRRDSRTVIGVLGCMAQNLGDDLFAQGLPVDFIAGPDNYRALPEMIRRNFLAAKPTMKSSRR